MKPGLRKLALTTHVMSSVGWLGAVVVYLALAISGLTSDDPQLARAAYLNLESIGWFVVVPFCLAALVTGLVQSLGTEWGLFRHYWILVKFLLTTIGTIVLLGHLPVISRMSHAAASDAWPTSDLGHLPVQLIIHAAGGLVILVIATTLSVFKPWGKTRYGRRKVA